MHRPSSVVSRWKTELAAGDAVSGAVVAAIIVVSFLSLMSFADFLRFHWQEEGEREGEEGGGDAAVAVGGGDIDPPAVPDAAIDDGFLERRRQRQQDRTAAAAAHNDDDAGGLDGTILRREERKEEQRQWPMPDRNTRGVMDQGELFFPEANEIGDQRLLRRQGEEEGGDWQRQEREEDAFAQGIDEGILPLGGVLREMGRGEDEGLKENGSRPQREELIRRSQELKARRELLRRERERRAPEDINRDATWDRLMAQDGVDADAVPVPIDRDHGRGPQRGGRRRVLAATSLRRQREREILQRQLDLAHAHVELNGKNVHEEESQDEEQEWDPAVAEFMARGSRIIQTEAGNATVGSDERHGDGDDDDAGSEIPLLPLNDKGIHAEDLFLNLDRPRVGIPVAAEIMARRARVIQAEAGNATVRGNKRHLDGDNYDDTGSEKAPPSVNDRAVDAVGIFLNLDPQRGGGPQRPLKPPGHEAAFLDDDALLFHTEPGGSEQDQRDKDRMARHRCDEERLAPVLEPLPLRALPEPEGSNNNDNEDNDEMLAAMMRAQEEEEDEEEPGGNVHRQQIRMGEGAPGNVAPLMPHPPQRGDGGGENDMFEPQFEPLDPGFDQEGEPADVEIHVALDELLGLRGPLGALIRNLLWLLVFNTTYLGLFAFIPHMVGSSVLSRVVNSTAIKAGADLLGRAVEAGSGVLRLGHWGRIIGARVDLDQLQGRGNSTIFSFSIGVARELNDESERIGALLRLPEVATILTGYLSMALVVFLLQAGVALHRRLKPHGANAGRGGDGPLVVDWENDNDGDELEEDGLRALLRGGGGVGGLAGDGGLNDRGDDNGQRAWGDGDDEPAQAALPQRDPAEVRAAVLGSLGLALRCASAMVKVGLLLFLKMLLLPLLLGVWLDVATLELFDATAQQRIVHAGSDLFGSVLLHWVAGITFMLLVTVSVLQLREVAHPGLLAGIIRPQEPQPDLLGNLLQEGGAVHAKRMVLSLAIYAALLSVHVWMPARFLVNVGLGAYLPPFRPRFCYVLLPQLQVPIELLIFHLSMLAFLEKYKNHIGDMQHAWLLRVSGVMGLTDHLLSREVAKFELAGMRPVFIRKDDSKSNDVGLEVGVAGHHHPAATDDVSAPPNLDEDTVTDATSASSAEGDEGGVGVGKLPVVMSELSHRHLFGEETKRISSSSAVSEINPFWVRLVSLHKGGGGATDEFIRGHLLREGAMAQTKAAERVGDLAKGMGQDKSSTVFEDGATRDDGSRALGEAISYIRLPSSSLSSDGTAKGVNDGDHDIHVDTDIGDVASDTDAVGVSSLSLSASGAGGFLLPTSIGAYRFRRHVNNLSEEDGYGEPNIELWREVPGKLIVRPPEGWDDLGVGGAEVQGRWAWGDERKSEIENSVAKRTNFFPLTLFSLTEGEDDIKGWRTAAFWGQVIPLMAKMLLLLALSWFVVLAVVCAILSSPLATGRFVFFLMRIPERCHHDPIAFAIGGAVLFPLGCKTLHLFSTSEGEGSMGERLWNWATSFQPPPRGSEKLWIVVQSMAIWLIVSPLLIGTVYDLCLVRPHEFWAGGEPLVNGPASLVLMWGFGTMLLNLWAALCYVGAFTRGFWIGLGGGEREGDPAAGIPGEAAVEEVNVAIDAADGHAHVENPIPPQPLRPAEPPGLVGTWQGDGGRICRFFGILSAVLTGWEWDRVDRVDLLDECALPILRHMAAVCLCPILLYCGGIVFATVLSCASFWRGNNTAGVVCKLSQSLSSECIFSLVIFLYSLGKSLLCSRLAHALTLSLTFIHCMCVLYIPTVPLVGLVERGAYRAFIFRSVSVAVTSFYLASALRSPLQRWFCAVHKAARDDRYLVGEILLNYVAPKKKGDSNNMRRQGAVVATAAIDRPR